MSDIPKTAADSFTLSDAGTKALYASHVKFYQSVVEFSADGQTPLARLCQAVLEFSCSYTPARGLDTLEFSDDIAIDLAEQTSTPLSQEVVSDLASWLDESSLSLGLTIIEVEDLAAWDDAVELFKNWFLDLGSDLNSWDDNYLLEGDILKEIPPGLDCMYFYDAIGVDFLAPATPLSKTAADSFVVGKNKRAEGMRDSISWELVAHMQEEALWSAADDIFVIDDDSSIQLGFLNDTPTAEDSLDSWDDAVEEVLGVPESYDSNMYNWNDEISLVPGIAISYIGDTLEFTDEISVSASTVWLTITASDSMFNLLDAIVRTLGLRKSEDDYLVITDQGIVVFNTGRTEDDYLSMLDSILISFMVGQELSDTLSITDDGTISLSVHLEVSAADTNSMSDTAAGSKSTSDLNYLRRYLNDVPRG